MPIQVGYPQGGKPPINLAGLQMQQRQMDMIKKQKQQEQFQKAFESVTEAYEKKKKQDKMNKMMKELGIKKDIPIFEGLEDKTFEKDVPKGAGLKGFGKAMQPTGIPTGGTREAWDFGAIPPGMEFTLPGTDISIKGQQTEEEKIRATITPTTAMTILSSPTKRAELEKNNPDLIPVLEDIVAVKKNKLVLNEVTAKKFLTQARGDKDKARKLAVAAGYTIP